MDGAQQEHKMAPLCTAGCLAGLFSQFFLLYHSLFVEMCLLCWYIIVTVLLMIFRFINPLQRKTNECIQPLLNCLQEVRSWLEMNFLNLNKNRTEIIVFGQSQILDGHDGVTGSLSLYSQKLVRNIGVIF